MAEDHLPLPKGFATLAIHSGQNPEQWNSNAVVPPISLSSTFKQIAPGMHKGFQYGRSGNPSRNVLEECLASLEGAKYGLTFSSGLGALSAIINILKTGDHILSVDDIYGGSATCLNESTERFGMELSYSCCLDMKKVKNALRPNTKLVFLETPTNPTMKVVDIKKIAEIVHEYNKEVIVAVDNTFLTPYFQRPLNLGADIVLYSLTKYMNGHSDVVMGSICTNRDDIHKKLRNVQNSVGVVPSPFDCYLVNRGLKTLPLRMMQHMKNSLMVAQFLQKHPLVKKVLYPGLPDHPQYEISRKQSSGFSGMLSIYIGPKGAKPASIKESTKFLQNLKYFTLAGSLGGVQSLAQIPSVISHGSLPLEVKIQLGMTDDFIRLSIGLEDPVDLCNDLDQALKFAFS